MSLFSAILIACLIVYVANGTLAYRYRVRIMRQRGQRPPPFLAYLLFGARPLRERLPPDDGLRKRKRLSPLVRFFCAFLAVSIVWAGLAGLQTSNVDAIVLFIFTSLGAVIFLYAAVAGHSPYRSDRENGD